MKRSMENQLTRWLQKSPKKPLVNRGARQVGKSTLVQNFARSQRLKLAEINLEKHGNLDSIFVTCQPTMASKRSAGKFCTASACIHHLNFSERL